MGTEPKIPTTGSDQLVGYNRVIQLVALVWALVQLGLELLISRSKWLVQFFTRVGVEAHYQSLEHHTSPIESLFSIPATATRIALEYTAQICSVVGMDREPSPLIVPRFP